MRYAIAMIVAFVVGTGASARAEDQTFPNITHAELTKAVDEKKVTLLDANGTDSYKDGHIPTALDFDVVEKDLASKLPSDKSTLIVAYCANEKCTAYRTAAAAAKKLGYTNIKHYAKGISGWKAAGGKVESAN